MDIECPILSGFLIVLTQSGFSINRISKKKSSNQKFCLLFKASRHGIERLEICESEGDKNPKIITLENCVKITQEASPVNLIHIVTKTGTLTLNTQTEDDLKKWLTALQCVAFKEKTSCAALLNRNSAIEEDNDLYCSSYGDGAFIVKLIPSETSIRCNLNSKNYKLLLTATELQLRSVEDETHVVAKWPYRFIRKYGYRDGNFTFEAGRKCETGEGVFRLDHTNPQEIFRCMSTKMKSMKKLINGESLSSLDCGESQLNAALSMEAGSRSPLPPSPNQSATEFENMSSPLHQSFASIRGFISSNDSLNNVSTTSSSINLIKHIPHKPPRKTLGVTGTMNNNSIDDSSYSAGDKYKKLQNYEPISLIKGNENKKPSTNRVLQPSTSDSKLAPLIMPTKSPELPDRNPVRHPDRDYECIENITDAWKTLGIDEVKHTEHVTTPEDDLIEFVWQKTRSSQQKQDNNANIERDKSVYETKIIIDESDSSGNYDRLEFFRSNSKISTSSNYKTVIPIIPVPAQSSIKTTSASDDYEIIGNPDINPCRLANDSYMGYGTLRQTSIPGPQVPSSGTPVIVENDVDDNDEDALLNHRQYNGFDYAIVSKPKRV